MRTSAAMSSATKGDALALRDSRTAALSPPKEHAATTTNKVEPDASTATEATSRTPLDEGQPSVFQKGDLVRVSPRYVRL
jgi:hypothetical protein